MTRKCNLCDRIKEIKESGVDDYKAKQMATKFHYELLADKEDEKK